MSDSPILLSFNLRVVNSNGSLFVNLDCFNKLKIGRWSEISVSMIADLNSQYNFSDTNMLSIKVAVWCVILVGLVIG